MIRSLHASLIGLTVLLTATAALAGALYAAGLNRSLVSEPIASAHLVAVFGVQRTELGQINQRLQAAPLSVSAWRQALTDLPWATNSVVKHRADGVTWIGITEREPFALWQQNEKIQVIDVDGLPIEQVEARDFRHLPLILGRGAPGAASALFDVLATTPALKSKIYAAVRMGQRRWDLVFRSGIRLSLPEDIDGDLSQSWARFAALEAEERLLAREVTHIDLRLDGQVRLVLTSQGRALLHKPKQET